MSKGRLEAFSDGVIAILITIMVLELRLPDGEPTWEALAAILPKLLTYVLSFVFLGIYWNNHHHMLHAAERVSGAVLWANLHLLFWLSLVPLATGWMGEHHTQPVPAAVYGIVLFMAAVAYTILQGRLIACQGAALDARDGGARRCEGQAVPAPLRARDSTGIRAPRHLGRALRRGRVDLAGTGSPDRGRAQRAPAALTDQRLPSPGGFTPYGSPPFETSNSVDFPRGMLNVCQREPAKCFARSTICPTWAA